MGAVDLDRFRAGYLRNAEALNRGEPEAAFAWVPPELEWHVLADAPPEVPIAPASVLRGREEVVRYFSQLIEEWNWQLHPREFVDPGDGTVVVHAVGTLTGRTSGLRGEIDFTQVWELREDGVPMRVRERLDDWSLQRLRRE
jgi:hypothetical protein